ncbi:MAG: sensor histidine kinase [Hylemonella sp.]|nr:sensor histidine kinase [Hylemonella sp.]
MFAPMWKSCCTALGALLLSVSALAQASAPVQLDAARDEFPLAGHLEWLHDKSTRMTLADVQAAPGWAVLPGMPNAGFTSSAIWLRLTLDQPAGVENDWRLSIDDTQVDEAQLHIPQPQGQWQVQRAGRLVLRSEWPLDSRIPTFRLRLAPGQHTVYLRLQAQHTLSHSVRLHSLNGTIKQNSLEGLIFGGYFGILAAVIVLQLAFWLGGRDAVNGWYLLYSLVLLAVTLLRAGYPQQLLLDASTLVSTPTLLSISILAPLLVVRLSAVWLELHKHLPRVNWLYQFGAYTLAPLALWVALTQNQTLGLQIGQVLSLLSLLSSLVISLWLWRRRLGQAGYYLLVFSVLDLGITVRFIRNLGWLPVNFYTDYAIFIGIAVHMVLMSLYSIHRYHQLRLALEGERRAREEQKDFVSMVSHEFRTPLAIINTSIQQLAANLDAPAEKSQQRAQNIRNAIQRMNLLLDDYLSLDRLDSAQRAVQPQPCDFYEVIEDAASDWPVGRVRIRVHELPAPFVCDPDLMRIVLRNLLANAVRHSPEDTMIELEARGQAGGDLVIRVQDWGEGIPPEELPRLFQRYFRGRASQGKPGAGLGLHLVQRIVQLHGGAIDVQSTVDQGTTFVITLPPGQLSKG